MTTRRDVSFRKSLRIDKPYSGIQFMGGRLSQSVYFFGTSLRAATQYILLEARLPEN
jgi:hypothetical protein